MSKYAAGEEVTADYLNNPADAYWLGFALAVRYTATGSFVKASYPGLRGVIVDAQGAGGGGGGTGATAAGTVAAAAGGGGGGYLRVFIPESSLAASETVTVGAAGTAGAAGANNGGTGGNSSFGTFAIGEGGAGGEGVGAASVVSLTNPGVPGEWTAAGTGVVILDQRVGDWGSPGVQKGTAVGSVGMGGGARFGSGGRVTQTNTGGSGLPPSNAGTKSFGGGGAGAWADVSQSAFAGGAGAQGLVIVTPVY